MDVRRAQLADLPAILSLERSAFDAPHWMERDYRRFLEDDALLRCLFVAWAAGTLAGFAAASVAAEDGQLESVAVDGAFRRRGIGFIVCRSAIDWAREHGAESMFLEVRRSSVGAHRLYEQLGFRAFGTRRRYYSNPDEDAITMRLVLVQPGMPAMEPAEV